MIAPDRTALLVMAAIFLATMIRSTFGFGEALVAGPLLALVVPVEIAAPVAVLASITIAFIAVVQDWRHIHLRSATWLVLSTLAGIPLWIVAFECCAGILCERRAGHCDRGVLRVFARQEA